MCKQPPKQRGCGRRPSAQVPAFHPQASSIARRRQQASTHGRERSELTNPVWGLREVNGTATKQTGRAANNGRVILAATQRRRAVRVGLSHWRFWEARLRTFPGRVSHVGEGATRRRLLGPTAPHPPSRIASHRHIAMPSLRATHTARTTSPAAIDARTVAVQAARRIAARRRCHWPPACPCQRALRGTVQPNRNVVAAYLPNVSPSLLIFRWAPSPLSSCPSRLTTRNVSCVEGSTSLHIPYTHPPALS
jgi:hypothetical protein